MQSEALTKRNKVIELAKTDWATYRYLFNSLSKAETPEKWLDNLRSANFFSAINCLGVKITLEQGRKLYSAEFWPVLWYLENLSKRNAFLTENSISEFLLQFIAETNAEQNKIKLQQGFRNFNTDRSLLIIMSYIPISHLREKDLECLSEIIDSDIGGTASEIKNKLAPKIFTCDNHDLIEAFLKQILSYKLTKRDNIWDATTRNEISSVLTDYWFYEIIKEHRDGLIEKYAELVQSVTDQTIEKIIGADNKQFEWYQIKTIENNSEHRYPSLHDYEYIISDLLRDSILKLPLDKQREIIKNYLGKEHEYFIRLAIYLIGQNYNNLGEIFWDYFAEKNPITADTLRWVLHHELFEFIKKNATNFTETEIDKIIDWIEDLENDNFTDEAKSRGEEWLKKRIAYNKLEWYKEALGNSGNQKIQDKIIKNVAICDWERAIPAGHFSGPITGGGYISDVSPKSQNELQQMPISQVAQYLIEFGDKHEHHHEKPNRSGLARELQADIKIRTLDYCSEINVFKTVPVYYLYHMFWAFREIWRDKKPLNWADLLNFSEIFIDDIKFWQKVKSDKKSSSDETLLIGAIADLIDEGIRNREFLLRVELFPFVQEILLKLIIKFPFNFEIESLSINDYINTISGKIFESVINIWWQIENKNKSEKKIENKLILEYERRLSLRENPSEFYYSLGQGFRGFWYYNKEWIEENIGQLFPTEQKAKLILALNGFFETLPAVYMDIYDYFKKNDLFHIAIKNISGLSERAKETLAHQLLLGEIESNEDVNSDKSLIKELIEFGDPYTLSRITWLFWNYVGEGNTKVFTVMPRIWGLINQRLSKFQSKEKEPIVNNLFRWPELLDTWTDAIPELIRDSLSHLPRQRSVDYLIEAFDKHYPKSPLLATKAFRFVIDLHHFPVYPTDKLEAVIEQMYITGKKPDADYICNAYGEAGIYYLKPLWEKYNIK